MTKQEFKKAWSSIDQSECSWWTYPLGWLMALWVVITCAIGWHHYDSFGCVKDKKCMWCGRTRNDTTA